MKTALVVDNNEFYLKVLTEFLQEEGYRVILARDGIAALRLVDSQRPDLILLDLIMPRVDGTRVCRYLKSNPELRAIPVVILSGILVEDLEHVRDIGADAFVAKMSLDVLLPRLRSVLLRIEEGCDDVIVEGFEGMFRREVVGELLEDKRFREGVISNLTEGAVELDGNGRILSANPAFTALVGRGELEVLDTPLQEVLGLGHEAWGRLLAPPDAGDESGGGSPVVALHDREVRLKASPVRTETGAGGYLVLLEDVTELLRTRREKEGLQEELARTEKLSALGRMIAGIAHELNNPLTGVLGFSQLLMQRHEGDEELERSLRKILREAGRCKEILENLQSFSKATASERQPEDLFRLVGDVLRQAKPALDSESVELVTELGEAMPPVLADRGDLRRVVEELIGNARKAMAETEGASRLAVRLEAFADRVHLEVEDNGAGIPPEDLERIFDPFFSTADVGQGMGMGLSVVYGIVRSHGGRVLASSQPGQGTTFTVDLPAAGEALEHGSAWRGEPAPGPDSPVVLVVDDEPVIRDLLADLLEARGVTVETAVDGVAALDMIAATRYHSVILDMKMPRKGGREVYEALRSSTPEMLPRLIFSTGDMVSQETRAFLEDAGTPVIQKPFRIDRVLDTIGGTLGGFPRAG